MNRHGILVIGLAAAAIAIVSGLILIPRLSAHPVLSGYIEGEPLYLASPVPGTVKAMDVVRGQEVAAGQRLFVVDPAAPLALREQAAAQLAQAKAQAQDARKGQRPVELAALDANIAGAEARARDAEGMLRRVSELESKGFESKAALDDARANALATDAASRAARRLRDAAALGARADQVVVAMARIAEAQAGLTGASARLADVAPMAPGAARIEDVFFQKGEWAPANQPILSLLPDDRIKVRFFVPEGRLADYRLGSVVRFTCDGCANGLTAKVNYISPRPEFTPPVIYSRESRDRLVYLIEAQPSQRLNPGQPVDVQPLGIPSK